MPYLIAALYVVGGLLSLAGVLRGYFVTLKPARRYKRAAAMKDRIDAEYREIMSKASTPQEVGAAEVQKSRQMRTPVGGGRTVESTIYGAFLGGLTREALIADDSRNRAWDLGLVGSGTVLVSAASIWSLFL